jgi:PAS domain S-box-containing protein
VVFAGPGEARRLAQSLDWSATSLGAIETWPTSLRGAVRLCLDSLSPTAIWAGADFTLIHNDPYAAVLGTKHPRAMGHPARDVWAEVWHDLEPEFRRVLETGAPTRRENAVFRLRRREREEEAYFTYTLTPIHEDDGRVVGLLNVCEETSESVHARAEREEFLAYALGTARMGAWELDLSDHTAKRSPEHDRIFGYEHPLPDWTYEMFLEHVLPEDRPEVDRRFRQAAETRGDWSFECRIRTSGGEARWIWASGRHHVDRKDGQHTKMVGIVQDITERKRAEEALQQQERRYRRLFENSLDAVYLARQDGTILDANDAACRMHHMSLDEIKRRGRGGLVVNDERHAAALTRRESTGQVRAEMTDLRSDGTSFPVEVESVLLDPGSKDSLAFVIARDITERKAAEESLRASELRARTRAAELQALLNTVPAAVWIARDPHGDQIDANAFGAELLRRMPGSNVSVTAPGEERPLNFFVARDGVPLTSDDLPIQAAARRGLEIRDFEVDVVFDDGTTIHLLGNATPVRDADGTVRGSVGAFIDITERKRAEEALRDSRAQLAAALASMTDAVFISDVNGRFVEFNDAFATFHRFRSKEECAKTFSEFPDILDVFLPDGTLAPVEQWAVPRALRGETATNAEYRLRRKDTGESWIGSYAFAPIRDAAGGIVGSVVVGRDVTAQKQAEDALKLRDAQFRALVEELHSGVALIDATGKFSLYNRRFLAMFGLAPDSGIKNVNDQDWGAWQVLDGRGDVLEVDQHPVRKAALTRMTVRDELVGLRLPSGGEVKWLLVSAEPLLGKDGGIEQIICTYHDVTDLKKAEAALRDADRRKDEFLGMLSHELRNPLAPIRNSIYILGHADAGGEQAHRARVVIQRQTDHLTRLVDDLLDVTRIARGKVELRRERVDVADIVRRAAEDLRAILADRQIKLHVDVPEARLWVHADEVRVAQVLGNLLQNAAKFTPAGGEVVVSVRSSSTNVEIRVRDTGVGIESHLLSRIFEPFFQLETSLARTEGGLGLGLALVKGIVELHGGAVRAESAGPGRGTEFVITLPVASEPGETRTPPAQAPRSLHARRVLVVDDNRDAAESLAQIVEMLGHHADVAYDGPGALRMAEETRYDVILCDLGLPGMSGYEIAAALRKGRGREMQMFAVSGYAQPEDLARAVDAGFDGHVAKPPDPHQIARLLA